MVRNAGRLQQVVAVLAKYGLAPWLRRVPWKWVQRYFETTDGTAISQLSGPARVREAITEIGTSFIKLGQILSTRPDIVGLELAEELSQLQSQTPPDSPATIRSVIAEELGRPVDDIFSEFEDVPLASASIGQVHRATLKNGARVVVKVQHSGIDEKIRNDLEIAEELARLAETYSEDLALYEPVATVGELRRTLLAELDFRQELRNLQAFHARFRNDPGICFPQAWPEFSTARVLTMEHLEGVHVANRSDILAAGGDPVTLADRGAHAFLEMVFRDGFFHADPHPGNLLLLPDGVIGIIDCGMVGRIDPILREHIEDAMMAATDADVNLLVDTVARLVDLPPDFDRDALCRDTAEFFDRYAFLPLEDIEVSIALNEATAVIRRHHLRLPARVSMLIRMVAVLEGTARQISPGFQMMNVLSSYRGRILKSRLSPKRLRRKLFSSMRHWSHLLDIMPTDVADILDRVKQGRFDVHLEHRRLDKIVNRLVLGVVTASLYIGSSLLWSRSVPPVIKGYSIPGGLGTAAAVYLTIRLLRAIRASGDI
ncbi:MAG: AarF/ABC1/UbiB kinase family protein [Planctomycetaceae bacterium]